MEKEVEEDKKERNYWLLSLYILIGLVVLLIVIMVIWFFVNSGKINKEENNIKNKLEGCLDKHNVECNLLFSSPDIGKKCETLEGDNKDRCFYKASEMGGDYCNKIDDNELKEECELNLIISKNG